MLSTGLVADVLVSAVANAAEERCQQECDRQAEWTLASESSLQQRGRPAAVVAARADDEELAACWLPRPLAPLAVRLDMHFSDGGACRLGYAVVDTSQQLHETTEGVASGDPEK